MLAFATDPVNKPPLSRVSYWHSRISPRQFCDDALGYYDQTRSTQAVPCQQIAIEAEFCQYLYGCLQGAFTTG